MLRNENEKLISFSEVLRLLEPNCSLKELRQCIEHAAHYLPAQGPIEVFVHHNTLHAFENECFESAVVHAGELFGCEPFMSEAAYREQLQQGRIRVSDLEAVLAEDLGDEADRLIAHFGTRYALRLAMLESPLRVAPDAELRWIMSETDALDHFREEVKSDTRQRLIGETRSWAQQHPDELKRQPDWLLRLAARNSARWSDTNWESFVLQFLWHVCRCGVSVADVPVARKNRSIRHRDRLLEATGQDTDRLVHERLIRFTASFLDQGFATWEMPGREEGFLKSFAKLYAMRSLMMPAWMRGLDRQLQSVLDNDTDPMVLIQESLVELGVPSEQWDIYLRETMLALRGWAGMTYQLEHNASWAPRPAAAGTFVEFLAVRLLLDRYAAKHVAKESLGITDAAQIHRTLTTNTHKVFIPSLDQRAYTVFQLAQLRGWNPEQLIHLTREQWSCLLAEIEAFSPIERRRVFHLAYERRYRNQILDAVIAHSPAAPTDNEPPAFQAVFCIDDREESFRRHLEEIDPECETFGIAGFYGVAMYYKGVGDAHYTPLCPVSVKPKHFVSEEPAYSLAQASHRKAAHRRTIGRATRQVHVGTRSLAGGVLTGLAGSLAAFPLVARILFPRTTAKFRQSIGSIVQPAMTQLRLERIDEAPSDQDSGLGYSIKEMADIVEGSLRAIGLTHNLARIVVICGHGSSSLNNPHEAAHDCGACGGGRGGPNARAFAQIANDPRVRQRLAENDILLSDDIVFVGGYHNTCDDSMQWYDLERIPATHRRLFERVRDSLYQAKERNAHERARRFESAELGITTEIAQQHVENRAEDLSQVRPEYGHCTNAICFVGRRSWSRGLFLDRRAFLTSYDPTQDDKDASILEQLLQAVIPVCAGISLEYYFSFVDPVGYGCGTKLPHNITSLVGVMDGGLSDLRTGLPWQMVEIHEPVRLLFVIETNQASMQRIIDRNPQIARLVQGGWVQLSLLDANTSTIRRYVHGQFKPYMHEKNDLPIVSSSAEWYGTSREHLGFATITSNRSSSMADEPLIAETEKPRKAPMQETATT